MADLTSADVATLRMTLTHDQVCFHVLRQALGLDQAVLVATVNGLVRRGLVRLGCGDDGEALVHPGRPAALRRLLDAPGVPEELSAILLVRASLARLDAEELPGSVRIGGIDAITERVEAWRRGARHRYISVHEGAAPTPERLRRSLADTQRLAARGLDVHVVFPQYHLSNALREHTEHLRRHGVRVTIASHTSHRLVIVDDRRVVVRARAGGPSGSDEAVFIEDAVLGRAFATFTDALTDGVRQQLSDPVVRTIAVLASGVKDSAAAKQLGVTERQFRRYVAAALDELHACSRFQAGLRAARLLHLTED